MSWGEIDKVGHWRIIAAGAIGGFAAAYVMNEFQSLLSKAEGQSSSGGGDNATVKAAESISQAVGAGSIPEEDKEPAGSAIHWRNLWRGGKRISCGCVRVRYSLRRRSVVVRR